jgi:hypothetical protein
MTSAAQIKNDHAETISCSRPRQKVARIGFSGYIDMKRQARSAY